MEELTAVIILSITSIIVVPLNALCLLVIGCSKYLRTKTISIITSGLLSMHLLQGVFVMPFYALKRKYESKLYCVIFRFTYMITFYGTCMLVLIISIDRLLATKLMTAYRIRVTNKRVSVTILFSMIYIIMLSLIPFLNQNQQCLYNPQKEWVLYMLFVNCALPYFLVVLIYICIVCRIKSSLQILGPRRVHNNINNRFNTLNNKLTKFTLYVGLTYGIAWTPSIFYYILLHLAPSVFPKDYVSSTAENYISFFMKYIKCLEGVTTPILYCYFHAGFRKEFKRKCSKHRITVATIRLSVYQHKQGIIR